MAAKKTSIGIFFFPPFSSIVSILFQGQNFEQQAQDLAEKGKETLLFLTYFYGCSHIKILVDNNKLLSTVIKLLVFLKRDSSL